MESAINRPFLAVAIAVLCCLSGTAKAEALRNFGSPAERTAYILLASGDNSSASEASYLAPRPAARTKDRGASSLGAFGSVAISARRLPAARNWLQILAEDQSQLFTDDCKATGLKGCDQPLTTTLRKARSASMGESPLVQLRMLNAAVNNGMKYGSDASVWGVPDHWSTPVEMVRRGRGDCEDFAIMKYWLLRSVGFSAQDLQLVVLRDTKRGLYHAVLAVHVGGKRYVLDNLTASVAVDDRFTSYLPIMSFVGKSSYLHGFETKRSDIAQMPTNLAGIAPGSGD